MFGSNNVDNIVKGFTKIVKQLQARTEKLNAEVQYFHDMQEEFAIKEEDCNVERARALRLIAKLDELLK